MPIKHIVINASPIICLFKSGLHDLLPQIFQHIIVPRAVIKEVTAPGKNDFPAGQVVAQEWLNPVADVPIDLRVAAWGLGRGESEVISYALKNPGYYAVLDDREARRCAAVLGCKVIGTVGIILLAKRLGLLPSLREAFTKLGSSGLWLSKDFVEKLCCAEGE
jgi:predicted nucleic acid-binding protein